MPKTAVKERHVRTPQEKAARNAHLRIHIHRYWVLYAMMLLPIIYFIVFIFESSLFFLCYCNYSITY